MVPLRFQGKLRVDTTFPLPPHSLRNSRICHGNGVCLLTEKTDGTIRRALVRRMGVDCIVALPDKLFLQHWDPSRGFSRRTNTAMANVTATVRYFIDARGMGEMITRAM